MPHLNPDDCFRFLNHLPLLDLYFQQEALSAVYHLPPLLDTEEKNLFRSLFPDVHKFVFDPDDRKVPHKIICGQSSFGETTFCQGLQEKFGEISTKFFYFNPWTAYDWHADIGRRCSINFALDDYPGSHTLFRQKIDNLNNSIVELNYKPRQPVILNTRIEHCVINRSDNPRYVLSVSPRNNQVTFDQMVDFLSTYRIDSDRYRS